MLEALPGTVIACADGNEEMVLYLFVYPQCTSPLKTDKRSEGRVHLLGELLHCTHAGDAIDNN